MDMYRRDGDATALRRIVACQVPEPDWYGAHEGRAPRAQLDKRLCGLWSALLVTAGNMRQTWIDAASAEVGRRERREKIRAVAQTCLRAWREWADGVPARAAKWDNRWRAACRHGHDCALARNMCHFTHMPDNSMMPLLLAHQRLVAAPRIYANRRRSHLWRRSERARQQAMAGQLWQPPPPPAKRGRTTAAEARAKWQRYAPSTHPRQREGTYDGMHAARRRRHDGQLRLHHSEYIALMAWGPYGDG